MDIEQQLTNQIKSHRATGTTYSGLYKTLVEAREEIRSLRFTIGLQETTIETIYSNKPHDAFTDEFTTKGTITGRFEK